MCSSVWLADYMCWKFYISHLVSKKTTPSLADTMISLFRIDFCGLSFKFRTNWLQIHCLETPAFRLLESHVIFAYSTAWYWWNGRANGNNVLRARCGVLPAVISKREYQETVLYTAFGAENWRMGEWRIVHCVDVDLLHMGTLLGREPHQSRPMIWNALICSWVLWARQSIEFQDFDFLIFTIKGSRLGLLRQYLMDSRPTPNVCDSRPPIIHRPAPPPHDQHHAWHTLPGTAHNHQMEGVLSLASAASKHRRSCLGIALHRQSL